MVGVPLMRLDATNSLVMGLAVASALGAFWVMSPSEGAAQPATMVAVAEAPVSPGAAQIRKHADGHFWAETAVDGHSVKMMVDTGASLVALTPEDAARLGITADELDYDGEVSTAAGKVRAAHVTLEAVSIAGVEMKNVEALVVRDGLPHSLLGMSYLGRLSEFSATKTSLTLRV